LLLRTIGTEDFSQGVQHWNPPEREGIITNHFRFFTFFQNGKRNMKTIFRCVLVEEKLAACSNIISPIRKFNFYVKSV
jgi:hypothetical protein